jgi:hypothetical protein
MAQPSCTDSPRRRCHALGAGTARRACPGQRNGTLAEGSPTTTAEEGFCGDHQSSEGMAPGKVRVTEAHRRWPARERGGEWPSGGVRRW